MIEEDAAARDELLQRLALSGLNPEEVLPGMRHDGRVGFDLDGATATGKDGIRTVVGVAIGPEHAIAMDDQKFVTGEILSVEDLDLIREVGGDTGVSADDPPETGADGRRCDSGRRSTRRR